MGESISNKAARPRRIGLFGGTFDPPHLGHLVAAENVLHEFGLEQIVFIPAGSPPHKADANVAAAEHRLRMTELATEDHPFFTVSRIEVDRPAPSYTVDTLRDMKATWGDAIELYFIIGADALLGLAGWKEPETVLRLCRMIAVSRPGFSLPYVVDRLGDIYTRHADRILLAEIPALRVAASDIRQRVKNGRSIRYLVTAATERYIIEHNLYRVHATCADVTE